MKNPALANWIKFEQLDNNTYIAKDELHKLEWKLTPYRVWFAKQLDGYCDPYEIDKGLSEEDVDDILQGLDDMGIIRDRKILEKGFLYVLRSVWFPRITFKLRVVSLLLNFILMLSWLPLTAFAAYYLLENIFIVNTDYILAGTLAGIFIGMVCHELGHMIACLGFGGKVYEAGLVLHLFVPGAYVLTDTDNIKSRFRRVQILAAGIEVNFVLFAIFSILSVVLNSFSGFFIGIAIQNAFMGFVNLLLIKGFDGFGIMAELLGVDELAEKTKQVIFKRRYRKKLKEVGVHGKAFATVCYFLQGFQLALPLLLSLNVLGVIEWIA